MLMIDSYILAQCIRIPEVLAWDGNSYFTHAILAKLYRVSYTLVELELMQMAANLWSPFKD